MPVGLHERANRFTLQYAQTMMSEVTPRGYENMFFGLFGITNRAVSIVLSVSGVPG